MGIGSRGSDLKEGCGERAGRYNTIAHALLGSLLQCALTRIINKTHTRWDLPSGLTVAEISEEEAAGG